MVLRTLLTDMLGIEHPIICGGMTATGSAELCAAVSNAGGLGMLTCLHCRTPALLDAEIARVRTMTSKPFGKLLGKFMGCQRPEHYCNDETPPRAPRSNLQWNANASNRSQLNNPGQQAGRT